MTYQLNIDVAANLPAAHLDALAKTASVEVFSLVGTGGEPRKVGTCTKFWRVKDEVWGALTLDSRDDVVSGMHAESICSIQDFGQCVLHCIVLTTLPRGTLGQIAQNIRIRESGAPS